MNSSDSTEENINRSPASQEMPSFASSAKGTSSASAESSSDSGNTEKKIPTPPSIKPQKKNSPNKIRVNILTPSKPTPSIKRPREPQGKEVSKQLSKKSKKPAQQDNKTKAAGASEAGMSAKKIVTVWNAKDEAAFLKTLVAFCEKGNGFPKNLGAFYEAVKNELDGDYNNDQLYNKVRGLRAKFGANRGKIREKGFLEFKNSHEESLYVMSKKLWGNRGEDEGCTENAGNGDNARGKKKKKNAVDNECAREEVRRNKNEDVGLALKEQEEGTEEEEDETGDEEREAHDQDEQNVNVNLSQQDTLKELKTKKRKEDVPSHIAGTGTLRSEARKGKRKEEEGCSYKVGNGDSARGEKKKRKKGKNVVHNEGVKEEVKMNKNEDVGMALKEQEEEKEEEEDENDDEEEGEGHDQDEQNVNVNLSQQDTFKVVKTKKKKEDVPSHIAGTGTQRSEARKGKREEEAGCSDKVGNGDSARGEKKKRKKEKNVVHNEGVKEKVKMNKNEEVGMTLKEQEKEKEEDEDENDDEEAGERHDQNEQNVNVNFSQQDTLKEVKTKKRKEDGPSHIAGTGTQRSEVRKGENRVSSEEDVGEEQVSSAANDESENESTDNENSALPDSYAAVGKSKFNIGGSSIPLNLNSAQKQTNGRENSTNPVSNGILKGSRMVGTAGHYDTGENSRQHVVEQISDRRNVAAAGDHDEAENLAQLVPIGAANVSLGMTDRHQMFDQLCKENWRIWQSEVKEMLDGFKNEILNIVDTVKKDSQSFSNTARATGFDFSVIKGFSFGMELPSLDKTEAEMIDQKWQIQQFIEMEAASKHLALLQEEYQLRMAKLHHQ